MKVIPARWVGEVDSREFAPARLQLTADMLLVSRSGTHRWFIMRCPCGCNEEVPVNLDSRTGPAWRLHKPGPKATLYPSIWRDTGCRSHFILHRGSVWLFTGPSDDWGVKSIDGSTLESVAGALTDHFQHFATIAEFNSHDPWDVYLACENLVEKGSAIRGSGRFRQHYRRVKP